MTIQVLVSFCVRRDKLAAFQQLMRQVNDALPKVAGCEAVRVMHDVSDPTRYTLLESWRSRAEHEAHLAALDASGDWARLREHLDADPTSAYLTQL